MSFDQHFTYKNVSVTVRRDDLLNTHISGNKFRKLKYNLLEARKQNYSQLLTFGGAYSNHIAAVAAAGKEHGFSTVGLIRGEELAADSLNPTLRFAASCDMQLHYLSRADYRLRHEEEFVALLEKRFGRFYLLPEGGTNALAVRGCEEILTPDDASFNYICVAGGTGGTAAGICNSAALHQCVLVFSALAGRFLEDEIKKWTSRRNFRVIDEYCFGGYAKINVELVRFLNSFHREYGIPLDPVYTGKMMFGILDMIDSGKIPSGSSVLAVHTGGLQGIEGMNLRLRYKNIETILC